MVPRHLTGRGRKDIPKACCAGGWAASDFEGSGRTGLCERRMALEETVGIRLYLFEDPAGLVLGPELSKTLIIQEAEEEDQEWEEGGSGTGLCGGIPTELIHLFVFYSC